MIPKKSQWNNFLAFQFPNNYFFLEYLVKLKNSWSYYVLFHQIFSATKSQQTNSTSKLTFTLSSSDSSIPSHTNTHLTPIQKNSIKFSIPANRAEPKLPHANNLWISISHSNSKFLRTQTESNKKDREFNRTPEYLKTLETKPHHQKNSITHQIIFNKLKTLKQLSDNLSTYLLCERSKTLEFWSSRIWENPKGTIRFLSEFSHSVREIITVIQGLCLFKIFRPKALIASP